MLGFELRASRRARRRPLHAALAVLLSLLVCVALSAPAGAALPSELDPTFGDGGIATYDMPGYGLVQLTEGADGSFTLHGADQTGTTSPWILQLRPDGTPDESVGDDGFVWLFDAVIQDLGVAARAPDGSFYVVTPIRDDGVILISRYDSRGVPDARFNGGGFRLVRIDSAATMMDVKALRIDAAGRLVIGGEAGVTTGYAPWISRNVASNGAFDPTFNEGRPWVYPVLGSSATPVTLSDLELLADGSIAGAGQSTIGSDEAPVLIHLRADGSAAAGVNDRGFAFLSQRGTLSSATQIEPTADGFVIATAFERDRDTPSAGGIVDVMFDDLDGAVRRETLTKTSLRPKLSALTIDARGRAVVGGSLFGTPDDPGAETDEWLQRVTPDGTVDPTFAPAGFRRLTLPTYPLLWHLSARTGAIVGIGIQLSSITEDPAPRSVTVYRLLGDRAAAPEPSATPDPAGTPSPTPKPSPTSAASPTPDSATEPLAAFLPSIRSAITTPLAGAKLARGKRLTIRGTAVGTGGSVHHVEVALRRVHARGCSWVRTIYGGFTNSRRRSGECPATHWLIAEGTTDWRMTIADRLPKGLYEIRTSAVLSTKLRETPRSTYIRLR